MDDKDFFRYLTALRDLYSKAIANPVNFKLGHATNAGFCFADSMVQKSNGVYYNRLEQWFLEEQLELFYEMWYGYPPPMGEFWWEEGNRDIRLDFLNKYIDFLTPLYAI